MKRAGMTMDFGPLRPSLHRLLEGANLQPRPPSAAELAEILQVQETRAATLLPLLLPPPRRLLEMATIADAAGSASASAAAASEQPVLRLIKPVQLVRLASLPARPAVEAPGVNVWLPSCLQGRPLTRSMSAAFAERAAAPVEQSAEPAAAKRQRR